ncbi:MAG: ACP S-malonyltransferase [Thermodesulfobacteriota bacterium]
METTKQNPEILAFCADRVSELGSRIKTARRDISAGCGAARLGAKTRREFDSKAPLRLVLVEAKPGAAPELLEAGLEQIDREAGENLTPDYGVFFGNQPPAGKLAFVFPGQGSQYPFMGSGLAEAFEESRPVIQSAERAFNRNPALLSLIYPGQGAGEKTDGAEAAALQETDVAQPALGLISLVVLAILHRHGLFADAACGHSFGELTALCAAGRIKESDLMDLAVERGRLMAEAGRASADSGKMLAVKAPCETIEGLIRKHGADVILANRNSPNQGVISGPTDEIVRMQAVLRKNRIISAILPVSAAFHSRLVMDAARPFSETVFSTPFYHGSIPVYSNTTAAPYPEDHEAARRLLGDHLTQPVNFVDEISGMYESGVRTFIEVGPKSVLTGLVKNILADLPHAAFSTDASGGKNPALVDLAFALCRAAALGYGVHLQQWPSAQTG